MTTHFTLHGQIPVWLDYLRFERRLSPHSVSAYQRDIALLKALAQQPIQHISNTQLRQTLKQLHAAGMHPRSLQRIVAAWRNFFSWVAEHHPDCTNPTDNLRAPKAPQPLPSALSVDEAQQLLDQHQRVPADTLSVDQLRDQAMFELLYSSGLRLSELVALDVHYVKESSYQSIGWVNLPDREVFVLGKGNKQRQLPIGSKALAALEHWLAVRTHYRRSTNGDPNNYYALYLGVRGKRIHPRMVQQRLELFAKQAGIAQQVHPHALRHSFASHMLQSAQDLRAVQELLGHENIRTTQIYTRLDFQHLAQVYDKAHPRAKRKPSNT